VAGDCMVTRQLQVVLLAGCTLGLTATISSHEESTHVAMTYAAIDYLAQFRPEILACSADLKLRIGDGVQAEDAYYQSSAYPLGNFMFHFWPTLGDLFLTTAGVATAYATCDSGTWGHAGPGNVCSATATSLPLGTVSSGPRTSSHSYPQLVADLKSPPGSAIHNRGLVSLGHYLHLLQDLTSPAHTRNDAHPHFPLPGRFGDPSLFEVVNKGRAIPPTTKPLIKTFLTPEQAFTDLQRFTSSRFWSEKATLKNTSGPAIWDQLNGYAYDDEGRRIAYRPWFLSAWTIIDAV
jgi:hypothetical protein